jgi:hypothetical protein
MKMVNINDLAYGGPEEQKKALVRWLGGFLGDNIETFTGPNARDLAVALATQQIERWRRLLAFTDHPNIRADGGTMSQLAHAKAELFDIAEATTALEPDKATVKSNMPLLTSEPLDSQMDLLARYPTLAMAFILKRSERALKSSGNAAIVQLLAAYNAAEACVIERTLASGDEVAKLVEARLEPYNLRATSAEKKVQRAVENLEKAAQDSIDRNYSLAAQLSRSVEQAESLIESLRAKEATWETTKKETLEGLQKEVREFAKIEASIDLWKRKARIHTWNYGLLGLVFGLSLIATTVFVFQSGRGYVEGLATVPTDRQALAIALLAIPTLAIAWLLRFIARLAIQNLALAHDAQQRHAQASTYLRLLGDPSKPISESERILALAALFRPLPGQGNDDVNPPTIAELLKEAQERIVKPRT